MCYPVYEYQELERETKRKISAHLPVCPTSINLFEIDLEDKRLECVGSEPALKTVHGFRKRKLIPN